MPDGMPKFVLKVLLARAVEGVGLADISASPDVFLLLLGIGMVSVAEEQSATVYLRSRCVDLSLSVKLFWPERLSASCLHMRFCKVDRYRLDLLLLSTSTYATLGARVVGSMSKMSRLQVPHRDAR
jgi:hypothetical protein